MRTKHVYLIGMLLAFILTIGNLNSPLNLSNCDNNQANILTPPKASTLGIPFLNYTFNGVTYDSSGNGPAVLLNGGAFLMTSGGIEGGCLRIPNGPDFGGISLSPNHNYLFSIEFTVMFWVKQYNTQPFLQELVRKGYGTDEYNFRIFVEQSTIDHPGFIVAGFSSSPYTFNQIRSMQPLSLYEWHLIAMVKSNQSFSLIIDGIKQIELNCTNNAITNTHPIEIGAGAVNTEFDELSVWTQALSEQEIAEYYKIYKPLAKFSWNPTLITIGQQVQFTDESCGGASPYSYFWQFDDNGATSVERNPIHVFQNASKTVFSVKLEIIDSKGNRSVVKNQLFVNLQQPPGQFTAWSDTGSVDEGNFTIFWSNAPLAQKYYLIENGMRIMEFPPQQNQVTIQRPPGFYNFNLEAWNILGSSYSNYLSIRVEQESTPPSNNDGFSLWAENVEYPFDVDGRFKLVWQSFELVEFYRIYQNNTQIAITNNWSYPIQVNLSGEYIYCVEAKLFNNSVYRSIYINVKVTLNPQQNQTNVPNNQNVPNDTKNTNNNSTNISDLIISFLQQNGLTLGLGGGAAGLISMIVNSLKKGKFKFKISKNLSTSSIQNSNNGSIDDFLDSDF